RWAPVSDPTVPYLPRRWRKEELIGSLDRCDHRRNREEPRGQLQHALGVGSEAVESYCQADVHIDGFRPEQQVVAVEVRGKGMFGNVRHFIARCSMLVHAASGLSYRSLYLRYPA